MFQIPQKWRYIYCIPRFGGRKQEGCRNFLIVSGFARLKRQTSSLHIIFYGGIVVCALQKFWCLSSCSLLFFSLPLIFTLLAASISHLSTAALFMFFFQRNSSPLFSVTRSSSFSVTQLSVDIKNNFEKDSTLLLFFLSKSLGRLCDFPPELKTPRVNCLWCHTC